MVLVFRISSLEEYNDHQHCKYHNTGNLHQGYGADEILVVILITSEKCKRDDHLYSLDKVDKRDS